MKTNLPGVFHVGVYVVSMELPYHTILCALEDKRGALDFGELLATDFTWMEDQTEYNCLHILIIDLIFVDTYEYA